MNGEGTSLRLVTEKAIRAGLHDIRLRRRWFWLFFWAYLPAMAIIAMLGDWVFPWAAFAWMGFFLGASMYVWVSRCPRCGERFHYRRGFSNPWTRKCLHCGLHLRADRNGASIP